MLFYNRLIEAILLKRENLYTAEVLVNNKDTHLVFCPNFRPTPGCDILGSRVWISKNIETNSKYKYILELCEIDEGYLVDINCYRTINLVLEALEEKTIKELSEYSLDNLQHAFVDLVLRNKNNELCYLSVNHTTAVDELNRGFFPETVTVDGKQQLMNLIQMVNNGHKAVLLFCVQNTGVDKLFLSQHIDKEYAKVLSQAIEIGVEVIAYRSEITKNSVTLKESCPITISQTTIG